MTSPADRERIEAIRSYALVWKGRDNYADDLQFLLDLLDAASIVAPAETLEKESLRARSEDRIVLTDMAEGDKSYRWS